MDINPFIVKYKAGTDKTILPGIHGRFATMEKAVAQAARCALHFGVTHKNKDGLYVGRAIIGIVVDTAAIERQKNEKESNVKELAGEVDDFPEAEDELEVLRKENAKLREKLEEVEA